MKSRSIKRQDRAQYPAILTQHVCSIKDILFGQKITPKNFAFTGTKGAIPSGSAWVANQNKVFASSCSLAEPAIKYSLILNS